MTITNEVAMDDVRELSKRSLYFLSKEILGFKDWDIVHDDLEKLLLQKAKRKLILIPRGHLKTSIVTKAYSIQAILNNPNARILIANQVYDRARDMLFEIKEFLTTKSILPDLFGSFVSNRWNEQEIVIRQRNKALSAPTIATTGVEGEMTSAHFDLIILDDLQGLQNCQTKEQRDKVKKFYRMVMSLLEPEGKLIVIGCLVEGSRVLMADGTTKEIQEIKLGDIVLTWKDGVLVRRPVEAVIPQGQAKVYRLKTPNNTIEATGNHPFLTSAGFKKLEDLRPGDTIICSYKKDFGRPPTLTDDEAYLLGFMFGDGWVTRHPNNKGSMRWATCFSHGVDEDQEGKIVLLFKKLFNCDIRKTSFGYYRTEIAEIGRWLEEKGLVGNAHTKRIPKYLFSEPMVIREKFLEGFIDADGHVNKKDQTSIELCNKDLILDIKNLAESCGHKVSNVYSRNRWSQPPGSPFPLLSQFHHISWGTKAGGEFEEIRIVSIEEVGNKKVWDLTINETGNFIAEGMVVHNTRWHFDDLYGEIMEKEPKYYDITVRQVVEEGKLIFPKKFNLKFDHERKDWVESPTPDCMDFVNYLKESKGIDFYSQYMNTPVDFETQLIKRDYFQYYQRPPQNLFKALTIDPAISFQKSSDYTALVVAGMDKNRQIYVLDTLRGHWGSPEDIIQNIFTMVDKWRPHAVGIESIGFQKTLRWGLEEEMRRRKRFFTLMDVKASTRMTKEYRIKALEPYYRNRMVFHQQWMTDLEDELLSLTSDGIKSRHDDLMDAFSYQLDLLVPGDESISNDPPPGSFEYELEQARKANMKYRSFFDD